MCALRFHCRLVDICLCKSEMWLCGWSLNIDRCRPKLKWLPINVARASGSGNARERKGNSGTLHGSRFRNLNTYIKLFISHVILCAVSVFCVLRLRYSFSSSENRFIYFFQFVRFIDFFVFFASSLLFCGHRLFIGSKLKSNNQKISTLRNRRKETTSAIKCQIPIPFLQTKRISFAWNGKEI